MQCSCFCEMHQRLFLRRLHRIESLMSIILKSIISGFIQTIPKKYTQKKDTTKKTHCIWIVWRIELNRKYSATTKQRQPAFSTHKMIGFSCGQLLLFPSYQYLLRYSVLVLFSLYHYYYRCFRAVFCVFSVSFTVQITRFLSTSEINTSFEFGLYVLFFLFIKTICTERYNS